jgi:acyl carrier protein
MDKCRPSHIDLKHLVANQRHCAIEGIDERCTLAALGIDSLGALDLVYRIEKMTGVIFPDAEFERLSQLPLVDIEEGVNDFVHETRKRGTPGV